MNMCDVRLAIWLLASTDHWADDDAASRRMDQIAHAGADMLFAYVTPEDGPFNYDTAIAGIEKDDRLTRICKLAKDRNIMVQPWVFPNGPFDRSRYPRGADGGYLSGAEVDRDGMPCATWVKNTEVGPIQARDMLDHHDIDGIHLDMVRYKDGPHTLTHPCQCKACRVMYRKHLGKETITAEDLKTPGIMYKFIAFRCACIRPAVERCRQVADEYGVPMTMAARTDYFNWALPEGQDWVQWARDGLLDLVAMMNYNTNREPHRELVKQHVALLNGCVPHLDGVGRFSSFGEMDAKQMVLFADDAIEAGAHGASIFKLEPMGDDDFDALRAWRGKR